STDLQTLKIAGTQSGTKAVSSLLARRNDIHPVPHAEGVPGDGGPGHGQKAPEETNQRYVLFPTEGKEPSVTAVKSSDQSLDGRPSRRRRCEASNAIAPLSEGWKQVSHCAG